MKAKLGLILQTSSIWKTSPHSSAQPVPWKVYILFLYTVTRTKKGKEYLRCSRTPVPHPQLNSGGHLQTPVVTWFLKGMAVWTHDSLVMQPHPLCLLTLHPYPLLPVKAPENKQSHLYSQGRGEIGSLTIPLGQGEASFLGRKTSPMVSKVLDQKLGIWVPASAK